MINLIILFMYLFKFKWLTNKNISTRVGFIGFGKGVSPTSWWIRVQILLRRCGIVLQVWFLIIYVTYEPTWVVLVVLTWDLKVYSSHGLRFEFHKCQFRWSKLAYSKSIGNLWNLKKDNNLLYQVYHILTEKYIKEKNSTSFRI